MQSISKRPVDVLVGNECVIGHSDGFCVIFNRDRDTVLYKEMSARVMLNNAFA